LLDALHKYLIKLEGWVAALSLLLMLTLSLLQILIRNIFDFGFPEFEIINRNLLVICGMMGAVVATSHMKHIKIDALTIFFSEKTSSYLRCPLALFSALVCAAMFYYSANFCIDEWEFAPSNERWALPFKLIYPIGFALLCLHFMFICHKNQGHNNQDQQKQA
jgi:TRAP-type C4-dicarboxylate transport system permease small subunit